jgi:hypothetical protein
MKALEGLASTTHELVISLKKTLLSPQYGSSVHE